MTLEVPGEITWDAQLLRDRRSAYRAGIVGGAIGLGVVVLLALILLLTGLAFDDGTDRATTPLIAFTVLGLVLFGGALGLLVGAIRFGDRVRQLTERVGRTRMRRTARAVQRGTFAPSDEDDGRVARRYAEVLRRSMPVQALALGLMAVGVVANQVQYLAEKLESRESLFTVSLGLAVVGVLLLTLGVVLAVLQHRRVTAFLSSEPSDGPRA